MLNNLSAAEVSETTRTLSLLDGNCGRKYRRFLGRLLDGSDGHIHLVFATGGDTAPLFKAKKAYAEHCLAMLNEDLEISRQLSVVGLTAKPKTGDIRITLKVTLDVATESVASMSTFCWELRQVSGMVLRYEEDPAATATEFVGREAAAKKRRAQYERQQNRRIAQHLGFMRA